jgi:hypothetical protein
MQWRLIAPGAVLVLGCGIPAAVGHLQANAQDQAARAVDVRIDQHLQLARELPANPPDVLVALVEDIGEGGQNPDTAACLLFSPGAAAQLDASVGTTSCPTAVQALHDEVSDEGRYINDVGVPANAWSSNVDTAMVDGCAANWQGVLDSAPATPPGPWPGHLVLTRQDERGWWITGYRAC